MAPDEGPTTTGFTGDRFAGRVTGSKKGEDPVDLDAGTYTATVTYDESCRLVGDGMFGCDAGLAIDPTRTVNFYYEHDMAAKPCLVPPQVVELTVTREEAVVRRRPL